MARAIWPLDFHTMHDVGYRNRIYCARHPFQLLEHFSLGRVFWAVPVVEGSFRVTKNCILAEVARLPYLVLSIAHSAVVNYHVRCLV